MYFVIFLCFCWVFFFKQKTAYEMRISDWSSDVCSSDLHSITASQGVQFDRMAVFDGVFGPGKQYIPSGIYMRDNEYDRKRYGIAGAFQWRSNDGDMELTEIGRAHV